MRVPDISILIIDENLVRAAIIEDGIRHSLVDGVFDDELHVFEESRVATAV